MKKLIILSLIGLMHMTLNAQDYFISFTGTGASTMIDSVMVENLNNGEILVIPGNQVLHLVGNETGISDLRKDNDKSLKIYPNSFSESITIEFSLPNSGKTTIEVFDILGKKVVSTSNTFDAGNHSFIINGLRYGIYAIKVYSNKFSCIGKFISNCQSSSKAEIIYNGFREFDIPISYYKSATTDNEMQYTNGDRLKISGKSGVNITVLTDIPNKSKVIAIPFIQCIDADGNNYSVVKIGNQYWTIENLKTTTYNDGTPIPNITEDYKWSIYSGGAYCNYDNQEYYANDYGRLYNLFAASTIELSPKGWRLPTDEDWWTLVEYLDENGYSFNGTKNQNKTAKSLCAQTSWAISSKVGSPGSAPENNNNSGFTALPGGERGSGIGTFNGLGKYGHWWSSSSGSFEGSPDNNYYATLYYNDDFFLGACTYAETGFSVRLVWDSLSPAPILTLETKLASNITTTTAISGGRITSIGTSEITTNGICWSTRRNPTIEDYKSTNEFINGEFTSNLIGLKVNTTYYVRAYATIGDFTEYGNEISFLTQSINLSDIEGNEYKTVQIGNQIWMAENLKTTKYNDGSPIPKITGNDDWENLTSSAYCNYDNIESLGLNYGRLYNWYTVETGKLAPIGWHVPTDSEWKTLENYLIANQFNYDGTTYVNKIAKSLSSSLEWELSSAIGNVGNNPKSNNRTGFTALPWGFRFKDGGFKEIGVNAEWWSSSVNSESLAIFRDLNYDYNDLYREVSDKNFGLYIRCIKDSCSLGANLTIETKLTTYITPTSAISGGKIKSNGDSEITIHGVCWSTSKYPTIEDNIITDDNASSDFTSYLTGLKENTTYYIRAFASNSECTVYGDQDFFSTHPDQFIPCIDSDGNNYSVVRIGTQVWTVENLKTTKYNDGTAIPNVTDNSEWENLTTGAFCNYDNLENNARTYGRLYNWYSVNTGKLAPEGWHVPTKEDWIILEEYLIANGYNYDGTKDENKIAKSMVSKTGWETSSTPGTPGAVPRRNNGTGFTAIPGGYRDGGNGYFYNIGKYGDWWSSTEYNEGYAYYRYLSYNLKGLYRDIINDKENGFSVRLVRD